MVNTDKIQGGAGINKKIIKLHTHTYKGPNFFNPGADIAELQILWQFDKVSCKCFTSVHSELN